MKKIFPTMLLTILGLVFLLCGISQAQYAIGDTADNFTLNDMNGNSVSLYDYDGKVILLNFFATW